MTNPTTALELSEEPGCFKIFPEPFLTPAGAQTHVVSGIVKQPVIHPKGWLDCEFRSEYAGDNKERSGW